VIAGQYPGGTVEERCVHRHVAVWGDECLTPVGIGRVRPLHDEAAVCQQIRARKGGVEKPDALAASARDIRLHPRRVSGPGDISPARAAGSRSSTHVIYFHEIGKGGRFAA
jgi:hypothetical protein